MDWIRLAENNAQRFMQNGNNRSGFIKIDIFLGQHRGYQLVKQVSAS
jgi:hypothetical protein